MHAWNGDWTSHSLVAVRAFDGATNFTMYSKVTLENLIAGTEQHGIDFKPIFNFGENTSSAF
jgi:hypothetical protein